MPAVRDLLGPAVVVALGLGFLALTAWNFLRELRTLTAFWPPVLAATLGAGLALLLVYAGLRLGIGGYGARSTREVAAWTLGGAAIFALITTVTLVIRLLEGRVVEESHLGLLISGEGGALAGFVAGSLYVEAKREAERAERARDTLGFLNSTLRHEVLNGVNVIRGWAERVDRNGSGRNDEAVEVIVDRCEDIADLIDDIRPMARTVTGRAAVRPTDLSAILADRVASIRATYPEATVTLDVPADVSVLANEGLSHVVANLLANAVEHNDRDAPTVDVAVTQDDERVRMAVADDGPGVPDAEKESVFEPDTSHDRGFGLYMSRTLVDRYGGELWVEDNDPRGAVFTVELERAIGGATGRSPPAQERPRAVE